MRDVWKHPAGHDILWALGRHLGRKEGWASTARIAGMHLSGLDRLAGQGFADALLEILNQQPNTICPPPDESPAWWKEGVIYHIYVPSFMDADHDGVGDIQGVRQRLPYLEQLGVNILWMWPVIDLMSAFERGVKAFDNVMPAIGNMDDLEALLDDAHARGMRVVMGLDFSSTSDRHEWFQRALAGEQKYRDYYVLRPGTPYSPPNNWGRQSGVSAWSWYPQLKAWALHLLGRQRLDLNWSNPAVRSSVYEVLKFWRGKGVDGFVMGGANLLDKHSFDDGAQLMAALTNLVGYEHYAFGSRLPEYMAELRQEVNSDGGALLVGEVRGIGPQMAACFIGEGTNLDMALCATHLNQSTRDAREDGSLSMQLIKNHFISWLGGVGARRWMPLMLDTPEHPRILSRLRSSPVYRGILAKMLAMMLMTMHGAPVIYQGQELGLVNTKFRSADELRSHASLRTYNELSARMGEQAALQKVLHTTGDHARTPMPWHAGPGGGFTGAQPWIRLSDAVDYLNANTQMQDANSVWRFYQELVSIRRDNRCFAYGRFNPVFLKDDKTFCYFRILGNDKWYVEMNITEKEVSRPGRILPTQQLVLSNYATQARTLRPYEANLYHCE